MDETKFRTTSRHPIQFPVPAGVSVLVIILARVIEGGRGRGLNKNRLLGALGDRSSRYHPDIFRVSPLNTEIGMGLNLASIWALF